MLTPEEKDQIHDAVAFGQWAEGVHHSDGFKRLFQVMRELFTRQVIAAKEVPDVLAAKARLEAAEWLAKALLGAIADGKSAASKRQKAADEAAIVQPIAAGRSRGRIE